MSAAANVLLGSGALVAVIGVTASIMAAYASAEKARYGLVAVWLWLATFNACLFFWSAGQVSA